jgi:hypothetical protein
MTYLLDFHSLGCRHVILSRGPHPACNTASALHHCILVGTHCTCVGLSIPLVFCGFFCRLLLSKGARSLYQRSNLCLAIERHVFPARHGPIRDTGGKATQTGSLLPETTI